MATHILVVDDETAIADLVEVYLKNEGFTIHKFYNASDALACVRTTRLNLAVLDVMLPGADGFELMEYIRPSGIPVIFLTARTEVRDRVRGLRAGADDYLGKPFEIVELLARVETVLRRYNKTEAEIRVGDVEIDTRSRVVRRQGEQVNLTKKEYDLMLYFIQNKNIALFRERIYEHIWESSYMGDSRTVDLHVQRLRKKLGWEERLTAVYKIGYRLEL